MFGYDDVNINHQVKPTKYIRTYNFGAILQKLSHIFGGFILVNQIEDVA